MAWEATSVRLEQNHIFPKLFLFLFFKFPENFHTVNFLKLENYVMI